MVGSLKNAASELGTVEKQMNRQDRIPPRTRRAMGAGWPRWRSR